MKGGLFVSLVLGRIQTLVEVLLVSAFQGWRSLPCSWIHCAGPWLGPHEASCVLAPLCPVSAKSHPVFFPLITKWFFLFYVNLMEVKNPILGQDLIICFLRLFVTYVFSSSFLCQNLMFGFAGWDVCHFLLFIFFDSPLILFCGPWDDLNWVLSKLFPYIYRGNWW